MTQFTPVAATTGGILIGLASVMLLILTGRIAGISGIVGGLFETPAEDRPWRVAFLLGLLGGGVLAFAVMPEAFGNGSPIAPTALVVAGLLVGFGTQLGGGCTSGHGVCGISRLSPRSLSATGLFIAAGAVTVFVTHHLVGA